MHFVNSRILTAIYLQQPEFPGAFVRENNRLLALVQQVSNAAVLGRVEGDLLSELAVQPSDREAPPVLKVCDLHRQPLVADLPM